VHFFVPDSCRDAYAFRHYVFLGPITFVSCTDRAKNMNPATESKDLLKQVLTARSAGVIYFMIPKHNALCTVIF